MTDRGINSLRPERSPGRWSNPSEFSLGASTSRRGLNTAFAYASDRPPSGSQGFLPVVHAPTNAQAVIPSLPPSEASNRKISGRQRSRVRRARGDDEKDGTTEREDVNNTFTNVVVGNLAVRFHGIYRSRATPNSSGLRERAARLLWSREPTVSSKFNRCRIRPPIKMNNNNKYKQIKISLFLFGWNNHFVGFESSIVIQHSQM